MKPVAELLKMEMRTNRRSQNLMGDLQFFFPAKGVSCS